ncbi:hypothetical protein NXW13_00710 [Bacteroides thetaiotaomicron]|nr:hypothetical protein [Bacteroides thetaiotaomicron]
MSFNVTFCGARPDGHGKGNSSAEGTLSLLDRNRTGRHHQRKADQEENVTYFLRAFESRLNRYASTLFPISE